MVIMKDVLPVKSFHLNSLRSQKLTEMVASFRDLFPRFM